MVLAALLALCILALALFVLGIFFWIEMLVDVSKHQFSDSNKKYTWVAIVGLMGILGASAYYFTVKRAKA